MEIKTIPSSVWIFLWHYFSRQKLLFFANLGAIIAGEFLVRLSLYYAAEIVGVISAGIDRAEALRQALALVDARFRAAFAEKSGAEYDLFP